jgi:hypothetical protein
MNEYHSPPVQKWVFRKPTKAVAVTGLVHLGLNAGGIGTRLDTPPARPDDAKAIEAEIARLQAKLATLKKPARRMFASTDLPLPLADMTDLLTKLAAKKFKPERVRISAYSLDRPDQTGVLVEGDPEVLDWATAIVKKLAEK